MNPTLPALATCVALVVYLVVSFNVGRARGQYGIMAPAMTGHPAFERVVRVHMNTLEQIVLFLPAMWLFAWFVSPLWAAILGLVWSAGRTLYAWGYYRDAQKRGPGFGISFLATLICLVGGFVGALIAPG